MIRHSRLGAVLASLLAASALLATVAAPVSAGSRALVAQMKGANVVPTSGDSDGWGLAVIKATPKEGATDKLCWFIVTNRIALPATAAHIGLGAAGSAGTDAFVTLSAPVTVVPAWASGRGVGIARGCADVADATLAAIWLNPAGYYLDVHNGTYATGAIRGQLR